MNANGMSACSTNTMGRCSICHRFGLRELIRQIASVEGKERKATRVYIDIAPHWEAYTRRQGIQASV